MVLALGVCAMQPLTHNLQQFQSSLKYLSSNWTTQTLAENRMQSDNVQHNMSMETAAAAITTTATTPLRLT
eukprot:115794-Amphidinium_carterae.1